MNQTYAAQKHKQRYLLQWLLCLFFILFTCGVFNFYTDLRSPIDQLSYDFLLRKKAVVVDPKIVIVAIDEVSLEQLGQWPWARSTHAQMLKKLDESHTAGVFFDVFFTEPSSTEQDQLLESALNSSKQHIVLPAFISAKYGQFVDINNRENLLLYPPLPIFTKNTQVGHVANQPDNDNVIRKAQKYVHSPEQVFSSSMSLLATQVVGDSEQGLINYAGAVGSFTHYSYADVLAGKVSPAEFDGKYVLIGATATGLGDNGHTPFGLMPGVEIHANILNNIINNDFIRAASLVEQVFFEIFMFLVLFCAFLFLYENTQIYSLIAVITLSVLESAYLLFLQHFWLSPFVAIILCLLTYILWSWWQLFNTLKYVEQQFKLLSADDVPMNKYKTRFLTLQNRFEILTQLQEKHQITENNNKELVNFLSHDLRTPQVNILSSLALYKKDPDFSIDLLFKRIQQNVAQTIRFAQDLIDLSRTQEQRVNIEEHNIQHLIQYALEKIQVQATEQYIDLVYVSDSEAEEWAWAKVDGALIERVIINLVTNAMEHSPLHSSIQITLKKETIESQTFVCISVKDQGTGIDPELQKRLLSGEGAAAIKIRKKNNGTYSLNIGWRIVYFTVVKCHKGLIRIDSEPNLGSIISILLPQ